MKAYGLCIYSFVGFVELDALQQEQILHYVIIMPEQLPAACKQQGMYADPLTAACCSE